MNRTDDDLRQEYGPRRKVFKDTAPDEGIRRACEWMVKQRAMGIEVDDWEERVKECIANRLPKEVTDFGAWIGRVTVWFKNKGVYGWLQTHQTVEVSGHVERVAVSTDGFMTVDLGLKHGDKLTIDGKDGIERFIQKGKKIYLRLEYATGTWDSSTRLQECQDIETSGALTWDGDGFFECHPTKGATKPTSKPKPGGPGGGPSKRPSQPVK